MSKTYISKCGYVIRKDSLSDADFNRIKKELVARPLVDSKYDAGDTQYKIYIETKNKIYIPKMYGINTFGIPEKVLDNFNGIQWERDIEFVGAPREIQNDCINTVVNECRKNPFGGGIIHAGTGMGKSFMTLKRFS